MAYRVVPDRQGIIQIGKIKENLVTEVELPAPGFEGGSYAVLLQRPRVKQPYPVMARTEGRRLIWTVQTEDTEIPGTGKLECWWYGDNREVAKSQTYMVRITDGLPDPTKAPEAWEGFIGQVARNAQAAQTAAGEAKASADSAAASAGIAQGAAADAGKLAGAAGDAANAAASAASAASSAQAGAETAGQNARAAAEAAETARSGAETAKLAAAEIATAAAGSAEAAAQAAQEGKSLYNQVKADLAAGKLKGEKGEKGDPGKDAPQIDDSVVSAENPWSSRHIVETLCPPISETGNPVTCYPVTGYPLGVKAMWEPVQEGSGDPSPDNIRPIKGRDSVTMERCGENMLDIRADIPLYDGNKESSNSAKRVIKPHVLAIGLASNNYYNESKIKSYAISDGRLQFETASTGYGLAFGVMLTPGETYSISWHGNALTLGTVAVVYYAEDGTYLSHIENKTFTVPLDAVYSAIVFREIDKIDGALTFEDIMLVPGTTVPTTYTPYIGSINTLTLPETVYGGEVDAVSGEGQKTFKYVALDSDSNFVYSESDNAFLWYNFARDWNHDRVYISSHYNAFIGAWMNMPDKSFQIADNALGIHDERFSSVEGFNAYLAAQATAGTPVQVAYKLATPTPITATGSGPIMPLEGETNTIMTDADSVAVTGRADPAHAIAALQAQLAVATQALAETQAAMVDTTAMAVDYIYEQDLEDIGLEEVDDSDNQTDTEPVDVPGV